MQNNDDIHTTDTTEIKQPEVTPFCGCMIPWNPTLSDMDVAEKYSRGNGH